SRTSAVGLAYLQRVLHVLHAAHVLGQLGGAQASLFRVDGAAQLHGPFERFHVDLVGLGDRIIHQPCFHLRSHDSVVDFLSGRLLTSRGRLACGRRRRVTSGRRLVRSCSLTIGCTSCHQGGTQCCGYEQCSGEKLRHGGVSYWFVFAVCLA